MKRCKQRPLLLIYPAVNALESVWLYNEDDFQSIAAEYLKLRLVEVARCEKIIAEKVAVLLTQQNVRSE